MKDYIVAENQQLIGNAGIPEVALQTAQNTRILAEHSIDIKTLSGEVHNMHEHLGKVDLSLQKVMENFTDPSTYKHFLIFDGQKLEADTVYTAICFWITDCQAKSCFSAGHQHKIRRPRAAAKLALTLPRSSILARRATTQETKSRLSCKSSTQKFITC